MDEDITHFGHRIQVIEADLTLKPSSCGLDSMVSENTVQAAKRGE